MSGFVEFSFDGLHSSEMDVTCPSEIQIGYPNILKRKEHLTGTNIYYDFSEVNGEQELEPRQIDVPINIVDFDKLDYRSSQIMATKIINWLMGPNSQRVLKIDKLPDFYFKAEVENGPEIELDLFGVGETLVRFTAYPYKIRTREASDRAFATFVFPLDVRQSTDVTLLPVPNQLPFKQLSVGDIVTLGGWSQYFGSGSGVSRFHTSQFYTIDDIREVDDVDFERYRFDKTQYFLRELNEWVRSQDIVQARSWHGELDLWNGGSKRIIPEINQFGSGIAGITIEKDGRFYNFKARDKNRQLVLEPGENLLKVYGQSYQVKVNWRDEVL